MGFGGPVNATVDVGINSDCPAHPYVQPPVGRGESASVHLMGRCGICLLRVIVSQCPVGLESVFSGVIVVRSMIWHGCRVAFDVHLF